MNLISTAPVAAFATDTHALLFLDGPMGSWFLNNLAALGVESTTALIESVISGEIDHPGLNTRPDGTPAQNVMLLPRGQTTLPSNFPTYQFVRMG